MKQLFLFGSSSAYGVGGSDGGWADLLKREFHRQMYDKSGVGEKYEVFNLAKSGATIKFVLENFEAQLNQYGRGGEIVAVVSVGGNNAKAEGEPDNFVSTLPEFKTAIKQLLAEVRAKTTAVIFVGHTPVDEDKTTPKPSPLTGGQSYFWNQRRQEFGDAAREICQELDTRHVPIEVNPAEWKKKYLYADGLHPNAEGHRYIFKKVLAEVQKVL